jgi:uncharacterized protein (TIGR03084 family)
MTKLEEVLADLAAESEQLDALVAPLDERGWRSPSTAPGWDIAHQVAHLAWTDEAAVLAATDPKAYEQAVRQALADPDGFVDAAAAAGAAVPHGQLLDRWRRSRAKVARTLAGLPEGTRIPWYGPPMSATSMATARFMETWAHGRDVAGGLGVDLPRHDRVRHVVHLGVRSRLYSFVNRGLEPSTADIHVVLTLPSGERVEYGPPVAAQRVTGSAYDFALLVTQRVHRLDADVVAEGPDAEAWLDVAQAFAGPPGAGRAPR